MKKMQKQKDWGDCPVQLSTAPYEVEVSVRRHCFHLLVMIIPGHSELRPRNQISIPPDSF